VVRRYALICAHLLCFAFLSATASAQNAAPILPAGDAAVAGFSGTVVVGSPPEARRLDKTFINLDGPALRVIGLDRLGAAAKGQLIAAKKPFTATARQIGQVFSVALDDANPPNIYAAATSAYGLPIVVPDNDGDGLPDRSRGGAPNAAFMPGLFGSPIAAGGPGSIWKINGSTGTVTLFANVTLSGVANSGPALGGLAFDPESHQLFVADRDTGMIHRFTLDGAERGRFDHGTQALAAAGLPPVPFDPRKRINLQNPAFDSTNPATWGYAPPARRIFGLAVNQGRLYYAVAAGLRIWSVALLADGSFGSDARGEVTVPRGAQAGSEISEILFDSSGDMVVAERGAPTGAYDYEALAEPGESRVLRFRPTAPDDPPSEDFWFPVPKEYAIGFPPNFHNDNGGIAIGYGYDAAGNINRAACAGSLWTSGERLRMSPDPAIARLLQPGGALAVHGLQGNAVAMVQPLNLPPFNSYFIDYYGIGERPAWTGHLGGVAIWRVCAHSKIDPALGEMLTEAASQPSDDCPAGYSSVNDQCVPTSSSCPPEQMTPDGKCGQPVCKPERRPHAIGIPCCPEGQVANNGRCTKPNGPDLSIDKKGTCNDKGVCKFTITVTNNGPGDYKGPIIVLEGLSPGTITSNQLISPAGGNFNCGPVPTSSLPPNVQQLVPPDVHLHACVLSNATLHPHETVVMEVGGKVTQGLRGRKPQNCAAVIGNPLNEPNYTNNVKCIDIPIPPPQPKYHIVKTGDKSCFVYPAGSALSNALGGGNAYFCRFYITVFNDGTVPLSGVSFTDVPTPPGQIVDLESPDGLPSWQCVPPTNGSSWTCTRAPGYDIPAGQNAVLGVSVGVLVSNAKSGVVENCVVAPGAASPNPGLLTGTQAGNALTGLLSNQAQQGSQSGPSNQSPQGLPRPLSGLDPSLPLQQGLGSKPGTGVDPAARARELLDNQQKCVPIPVGTPQPDTPQPPQPPPPPPPPNPPCADGSARNSDGNCPTPTTTSCPFPTFNVNGTCCTREALTARTCGTTTQACPDNARRGLDGKCYFIDPGCQGPNCLPVTGCAGGLARNSDGSCPTTTTTCPPAQVSVNGTCCNIRDYQAGHCGGTPTVPCRGKDCPTPGTGLQSTCQFPKLLIGGQCVCRGGTVGDDCHVPTTQTCPNAQVSVNGTCCNIRDYQTGHCGGTPDLCPNGKPKKDGQCPTTPDCTGGKSFDGSACRCKFGMTEGKNGQCVRSQGDSKKTTCGRGMYLVNGECVRKSQNLNQKTNKPSDVQKLKSGRNVNTAPLVNAIGQGSNTKSSGGSKGKGH
jgi:hypothetical protein